MKKLYCTLLLLIFNSCLGVISSWFPSGATHPAHLRISLRACDVKGRGAGPCSVVWWPEILGSDDGMLLVCVVKLGGMFLDDVFKLFWRMERYEEELRCEVNFSTWWWMMCYSCLMDAAVWGKVTRCGWWIYRRELLTGVSYRLLDECKGWRKTCGLFISGRKC